jgi:hypothetical protein
MAGARWLGVIPLTLRNFRFWQILLQKSKIEQPQNLAKVDLWASLRLRRSLAPRRRPVIDFG